MLVKRKISETPISRRVSIHPHVGQFGFLVRRSIRNARLGPFGVTSRAQGPLVSDSGSGIPVLPQPHGKILQGIFGFHHPIGVRSTSTRPRSSSILDVC